MCVCERENHPPPSCRCVLQQLIVSSVIPSIHGEMKTRSSVKWIRYQFSLSLTTTNVGTNNFLLGYGGWSPPILPAKCNSKARSSSYVTKNLFTPVTFFVWIKKNAGWLPTGCPSRLHGAEVYMVVCFSFTMANEPYNCIEPGLNQMSEQQSWDCIHKYSINNICIVLFICVSIAQASTWQSVPVPTLLWLQ